MWGERAGRLCAAAVLALIAWWLPDVRATLIRGVVYLDAVPGGPPPLAPAPADAVGLPPTPFVRVVLIDGANLEDAREMPAWSAVCARGVDLEVDVGFPTVSLPVQVALWTGLTQQQTGVLYHYGKPLADPLGARGIPARVPGSIAVAENHVEIVSSLGFTTALPAEEPQGWQWSGDPKAKPPDAWAMTWEIEARNAVTGAAPLAFVHILRVDTAGHRFKRGSPAWGDAVASADRILGELVAAGDRVHPDARWFVLADHGHRADASHGGEERSIRRVRACIGGLGVAEAAGATEGGPIALVDVSRAIADSLGLAPAPGTKGRPLAAAIARPLQGDELVPGVPTGRAVVAWLLLAIGVAITAWALGQRTLLWGPWWWPVTLVLVLVQLGSPSLSTSFVFAPRAVAIVDAARWGTYVAALACAAAVLWARWPGWRIGVAHAALPASGILAALVLCGGLPALWGEPVAAIAPTWTAWASVLLVITAKALWALSLALLATAVLPGSGPSGPRGTRRSAP